MDRGLSWSMMEIDWDAIIDAEDRHRGQAAWGGCCEPPPHQVQGLGAL